MDDANDAQHLVEPRRSVVFLVGITRPY
jgi:hypothetical protein